MCERVRRFLGKTRFRVPWSAFGRWQASAGCRSVGIGAPTAASHVVANRERLIEILWNLLSNAVKYNREGGMITVSAENNAAGSLCIRIADTGVGISA